MSQNGFKLGVVMLATRFPRPLGDIGNPESHGLPVEFLVAPAATTSSVVSAHAIPTDVVDSFIEAAKTLVDRGCHGITTSCGFACGIHDELQAALPVPIVSSSLNLVPHLASRFGTNTPLPVITYDSQVLSKYHFGRFWAPNVVVQGIEKSGELYTVIKGDKEILDASLAERGVLESVEKALSRYPTSKAILLECTNLPPYRQAIEKYFGLPVFDIFSALETLFDRPGFRNFV
ncbi:hypothetical protein [Pseudomonas sp. WHRI 8519]|uniref:hypothetical protein n=1 Tax=Pseudomonas sp. WHRI 8519 TaxID=3162567 RepID=UPI0032ED48EE